MSDFAGSLVPGFGAYITGPHFRIPDGGVGWTTLIKREVSAG